MTDRSAHSEAVELLQRLGLSEYPARCFVALSRLPDATAKEISEVADVPRTRVYDAGRVLASKGLVETQHSSPKRYRAIPVEQAIDLLEAEYRSRTQRLGETLQAIDRIDGDSDPDPCPEVWALSGDRAITNRTRKLVEEAETDVVLAVGDGGVVTGGLAEALRTAQQRATVTVLTGAEEHRQTLTDRLPAVEPVVTSGDWLGRSSAFDGGPAIGWVLSTDRNAAVIRWAGAPGGGDTTAQAVVARGAGNGFVLLVHQLLLAEGPPEPTENRPREAGLQ